MIPTTVKRVPEFSRAVDEDDENFDYSPQEENHCVLSVNSSLKRVLSEQGFLNTKYLFIGIGSVCSAFLESHILGDNSAEIIGAIFTGFETNSSNSLSQNGLNDKNCFVYRLKEQPETLFCLCRVDIREELHYDWTQKICSLIDASKTHVSILNCQNVTQYKGVAGNDVPFLRCLLSHVSETDLYRGYPELLEQPNLVEGLSAQLLTHCHLHKISASMFILFQESSYYVDALDIKAFSPLLSLYPFKALPLLNKQQTETILTTKLSSSEHSSTIYT